MWGEKRVRLSLVVGWWGKWVWGEKRARLSLMAGKGKKGFGGRRRGEDKEGCGEKGGGEPGCGGRKVEGKEGCGERKEWDLVLWWWG